MKRLITVTPHGFCAGVVRAVDIVERLLADNGAPVYVRKEIVHNKYVVNDLKTKGIACLEESLIDKTEDIITVRGKECFVVMKVEQYHHLRRG